MKNYLFLLLLLPFLTDAQILDDSTRQVYGFKSVGFRVEREVFLNDTTFNRPDSTIGYFHRMSPNEKNNYSFQDLGNIGSAARSISYQTPTSAGVQFGYNAFDLYRQKRGDIRYYNTRSPYTKMEYQQTNRGGAYLNFLHSQNITSDFNITLDVNRTASSKQINPGTNREERLINGWNAILSSNFVSKNKKYNAIAHFNHFNFQQIEQGGILYDLNQFFFPTQDSVNLYNNKISEAASRTYKNTFSVSQQLKLSNGFDAFYQFELNSDSYGFYDDNLATNSDSSFYSFISIKPDTIDWRSKNYVVQNAVGLRGYYKGFLANAYVKQRFVDVNFRNSENREYDVGLFKENEILLGGGASASFKDSLFVMNANTEINLDAGFVLNAEMAFDNFNLKGSIVSSIPDIIFRRFQLTDYSWAKDSLRNQSMTAIEGNYKFKIGRFNFKPFAKNQLITNFLYFDENSLPVQNTGETISISTVGLRSSFNLGNFFFDNEVKINTSPQEKYPMPRFENNFLVYFDFNYAKELDLRIGLDNYFKSAYYAQAYNPVIQQFYLQQTQQVWGYNLTDAFVSFMVNKVKLSFKMSHINSGLIPRINVSDQATNSRTAKALIITPDYPSLRRSFNIHVLWPLFD